jgi:uncharacterized cupin superfamily protein
MPDKPGSSIVEARQVAPRASTCPAPFAAIVAGREAPAAASSLRHAHSRQDEFVYILEGEPTLVTGAGETVMRPGTCAGFKAGSGDAHHLVNRTGADVVYLEVGDRSSGDVVSYPDDDLLIELGSDGRYRSTHKDGTPF